MGFFFAKSSKFTNFVEFVFKFFGLLMSENSQPTVNEVKHTNSQYGKQFENIDGTGRKNLRSV